MVTPPWDIIITASRTNRGSQPDELSRSYSLASGDKKNERIEPDSTEEVYLLWGIEFGESTEEDSFRLSISNDSFSIDRRILGGGTIKSGIPVFASWTTGDPIRVAITNETEVDDLPISISLKFIRFPTRESWAAFEHFIDGRYDHRPFLEAAKSVGGK